MTIKRGISIFLLAAGSAGAMAQDEPERQIAARFQAMYPQTSIDEVRASQISGIYEVVMGKNIAYTDDSGRYFLFGHLFDMQEQVDVTAKRQSIAKLVPFPIQHLDNAIKHVQGDGSRRIAVFSDPDCPYCKQLEAELRQLDNVTIYTFMYPLVSLHPLAKARAIAVWCAPNRPKAWRDVMLTNKIPALYACPNPIDDNIALGGRLGLAGTPTMIAADGRTLVGMASAERIELWLRGAK